MTSKTDNANTKRDEAGRFAKGNRFWEARSSAGVSPIFDNGDDLWTACVEYFEHVADTPLHEGRVANESGKAKVVKVEKMRPMTIGGLCVFLDISVETWRLWRKDRSDLVAVITRVEEIMRDQKFAGAAAGLFNANIIARDLGLADKAELSGVNGGPIETASVIDVKKLSDNALQEIMNASTDAD